MDSTILDQFFTIAGPATADIREKASKFLAFAYPVRTEQEVSDCLEPLRKLHPKANHHCYAYRLGVDGNRYRANDDGEPSGTAGRPILGQIDSAGLTDVLVVVVRYFGGTKLGASGLIQTYKESAAAVLQLTQRLEKTIGLQYLLSFDYAQMGTIMNALKRSGIEQIETHFGNTAAVTITLPRSLAPTLLNRFKSLAANLPLEMIENGAEVPGLTLEQLPEVVAF